jgi:RND family efflux transporter MFP subunit
MRKVLSIVIICIIAVSCGSGDDPESIRDQISTYKDEVNQLNIRIRELEQKLLSMGQEDDAFAIPVNIMEINERPFRHYFEVSGSVDAVDQAYISPEINGQLEELFVDEGEKVISGQLLAKLNTSITENTISEVKTQLRLATTLFEKQSQLWEKNIGSEVQYLQAKNNKEALESKLQTLQAQLDMAYIKSPINGIVDRINIEEGELAIPGVQIMYVINLENMKVVADVSEKYMQVIDIGDTVLLDFPSFPDLGYEVPVYRTGNTVNPGNRTFPVELRIRDKEKRLKPNLLATMTFLDFYKARAIVIPSIIIKEDLEGAYVYVVRNIEGNDLAKKVYIEVGMAYNEESMITDGLMPGDKVITKGYSLVTDGSEVNIM